MTQGFNGFSPLPHVCVDDPDAADAPHRPGHPSPDRQADAAGTAAPWKAGT
jgi:hypothetical protein